VRFCRFTLFHLRERAIPVWIILGHGAVAPTGFGLLLVAIYAAIYA
jgi:hypothetical protein